MSTPATYVGTIPSRTATGRLTRVHITYSPAGGFYHTSIEDPVTGHKPKVAFDRHGLQLGCTYIENAALDRLIAEYTDHKIGSRVIQ